MKITYSKDANKKKFGNLECGQVFLFNDHYIMKTAEVYDDYDDRFNAVYLSDGSFTEIAHDADVELVCCELIVS